MARMRYRYKMPKTRKEFQTILENTGRETYQESLIVARKEIEEKLKQSNAAIPLREFTPLIVTAQKIAEANAQLTCSLTTLIDRLTRR